MSTFSNPHDMRDTNAGAWYRIPAWAFWLLIFALCCAIAFFILLCIWGWHGHWGGTSNPVAYTDVGQNAILNNANAYYGKRVVTGGVVDRVVGNQSFLMGGNAYGGDMLVISKQPLPKPATKAAAAPLKGDVAIVRGVVQPFHRAAVEHNLGITLPADHYGTWEGKPVVIASNVGLTSRVPAANQQGPATEASEPPPTPGAKAVPPAKHPPAEANNNGQPAEHPPAAGQKNPTSNGQPSANGNKNAPATTHPPATGNQEK